MSPARTKPPLAALAALALLAALAATQGCASVSHWASTPSRPFGAYRPPPPPDYAEAKSWAALPWRRSAAQDRPPGVAAGDLRLRDAVDVFFLHPTTYFGRGGWNADIDGLLTRLIVSSTLAGQASAFNAAGQIFAPRYRQMTLSGFDDPEVRERALDLAYTDVRAAFAYYLEHYNEGRPIVLAGHSQGSRHLLRLLDNFFAEGPVRERLVAAYPVGARVWMGPYERGESEVPICEAPTQTGCLVSWRTFARGADASLDANPGEPSDGASLCVNPLTWRFDETPAPAADNRGSIPLPFVGGPSRPEPGLVGAQCEEGYLWIEPPRGCGYRIAHTDGNYHAYDYELFYMNVRENAVRRAEAYLRRPGGPPETARGVGRPRGDDRLCVQPHAEAHSRVRGRTPRQRRFAACEY